jgi:long-chain fatty acid transport protein
MRRAIAIGLGSAALVGICIGVPARCAHASGFQLHESSARLLGTAFAGSAALAEDATTGYYNVAGLTRIEHGSVAGSVTGFLLNLDFQAKDSTIFGATPVSGDPHADPTRNAVVPSFHIAYRLDDRWVVGFGVTAPFGLETKYGPDSVVRYVATKSELVTYNLNPMIAYRITKQFSFGAGFNAQFLEAKLEQKLPIPVPGAPDGDLFAKLNNWGWGANVGFLFEPTDDMRFGLNYRSQINYNLGGPVIVRNTPFKSGSVSADLTVPDTVTLSGLVPVIPGLQLLGDLSWTHWNVFHSLEGTFDNGLPNFVIQEDFRDTWQAALGLNYDIDAMWSVRLGGAFDQSPVTDSTRTVRIPDSSRWLLAFGAGCRPIDGLTLDLGYLHTFFAGGSVNETLDQFGTPSVRGNYTNGTGDLIAAQATYNFAL